MKTALHLSRGRFLQRADHLSHRYQNSAKVPSRLLMRACRYHKAPSQNHNQHSFLHKLSRGCPEEGRSKDCALDRSSDSLETCMKTHRETLYIQWINARKEISLNRLWSNLSLQKWCHHHLYSRWKRWMANLILSQTSHQTRWHNVNLTLSLRKVVKRNKKNSKKKSWMNFKMTLIRMKSKKVKVK